MLEIAQDNRELSPSERWLYNQLKNTPWLYPLYNEQLQDVALGLIGLVMVMPTPPYFTSMPGTVRTRISLLS